MRVLSRINGENLVVAGRPNGAPSMYKAHSTKSSGTLLSAQESGPTVHGN